MDEELRVEQEMERATKQINMALVLSQKMDAAKHNLEKFRGKPDRVAMAPKEIEDAYGIPAGTLANWRYRKVGPKYYRVSRKVFYLVRDFDEWFRQEPVLTLDSLPEVGK
ncbi:MAG: hypothetical protein JRD43_00490 [Deltaproteobacteria bacterium]|nr:hypothetical protein [Deltaproteobacteria bacterium]